MVFHLIVRQAKQVVQKAPHVQQVQHVQHVQHVEHVEHVEQVQQVRRAQRLQPLQKTKTMVHYVEQEQLVFDCTYYLVCFLHWASSIDVEYARGPSSSTCSVG